MYKYDFAVSYARDVNHEFIKKFVRIMRARGFEVFFDEDYQNSLSDRDLVETLTAVFKHESNSVIVFISKEYFIRNYTTFEYELIRSRTLDHQFRKNIYIYYFDETPCDLLTDTVLRVGINTPAVNTPENYADYISGRVGVEACIDSNDSRKYITDLFSHLSTEIRKIQIKSETIETEHLLNSPVYEAYFADGKLKYGRLEIVYGDAVNSQMNIWLYPRIPLELDNSESFRVKIHVEEGYFKSSIFDYTVTEPNQPYKKEYLTYPQLVDELTKLVQIKIRGES